MRFLGAAVVLTAVFACPCMDDGMGVSAAQSGRGINPDDASFYRVPVDVLGRPGLGLRYAG